MDSNRPRLQDSSRHQPTSSRATQQMSLEDKQRRETFKMAYFTEIGAVSRPIDISEFHDLAICAGVDIDKVSISEAWPKGKEEITMDEAYHLFTRLPNLELKIKHAFDTIPSDSIPFDSLIESAKKRNDFSSPDKKDQFLTMLEKWKQENVTASQALFKFNETKMALRDMNKALSDRARQEFTSRSEHEKTTSNRLSNGTKQSHGNEISIAATTTTTANETGTFGGLQNGLHEGEDKNQSENHQEEGTASPTQTRRVIPVLDVELSDSGDYSSVFVEEHMMNDFEGDDRPRTDTSSVADTEMHMFKTTRKSLVKQKKDGTNTSVGHVFTLNEVRTVQIQILIDEKNIDLNRFENALYGVLQRVDGQVVVLTTRKDGKNISTDKCTLFPGTYIFYVNFCRKQPERADKPFESMVDKATGKLSPKYRVCVMNIFDIFDFNDDQVLDHDEFSMYNTLNGSGSLPDEEWEALLATFDTRDRGLTLKAFVDMHQFELDSYEDKTNLKDMWTSLKALGFNERFQMAESCPIFVEYYSSDEEIIIDQYNTEYCETAKDADLVDYYWKHSDQLPYMKDMNLRLYSTDYYAVLMAGNNTEETYYHLRLEGSKNVNLDVEKSMVIEKAVPAGACEILCVGIAVDLSHDWFISVRKPSRVSTTS